MLLIVILKRGIQHHTQHLKSVNLLHTEWFVQTGVAATVAFMTFLKNSVEPRKKKDWHSSVLSSNCIKDDLANKCHDSTNNGRWCTGRTRSQLRARELLKLRLKRARNFDETPLEVVQIFAWDIFYVCKASSEWMHYRFRVLSLWI